MVFRLTDSSNRLKHWSRSLRIFSRWKQVSSWSLTKWESLSVRFLKINSITLEILTLSVAYMVWYALIDMLSFNFRVLLKSKNLSSLWFLVSLVEETWPSSSQSQLVLSAALIIEKRTVDTYFSRRFHFTINENLVLNIMWNMES